MPYGALKKLAISPTVSYSGRVLPSPPSDLNLQEKSGPFVRILGTEKVVAMNPISLADISLTAPPTFFRPLELLPFIRAQTLPSTTSTILVPTIQQRCATWKNRPERVIKSPKWLKDFI